MEIIAKGVSLLFVYNQWLFFMILQGGHGTGKADSGFDRSYHCL